MGGYLSGPFSVSASAPVILSVPAKKYNNHIHTSTDHTQTKNNDRVQTPWGQVHNTSPRAGQNRVQF